MSTQTIATRSTTFTIGWIVLLIISALSVLWFILLMFAIVDEAPVLHKLGGF